MPRVSAEELLIQNHVTEAPRPDAPYELTDDEAIEWRAIVASMEPEHFAHGNFGLLAQYCRHLVAARKIGHLRAACEKAKQIDVNLMARLLKLQQEETKAIIYLATKMRLTQQSIYRGEIKRVRPLNGLGGAGAGTIQNPWDDDE